MGKIMDEHFTFLLLAKGPHNTKGSNVTALFKDMLNYRGLM